MKQIHFRNKYGEIKNGFDLEILVTDKCNLKCRNCDHFAPISSNWFLSAEQLNKELNIITSKIPQKIIKTIFLLGGEPFVNSDFFNIIKIVRKYFPLNELRILTNGIKLSSLNIDNIQCLKENNVDISLTTYPINLNYNEIKEKFSNFGIKTDFLYPRLLFEKILINPKGDSDLKQFYHCGRYTLPVLTLKDGKIFECPTATTIQNISNCYPNINIPIIEEDYIDINNLSLTILEKFCNTPKPICKFCNIINNDMPEIWSLFNDDYKMYYYTEKDYYLYDYEKYYSIYHNHKQMLSFLNNQEIINRLDYYFMPYAQWKYFQRYKAGKIDIIIPYYKVNDILIKRLKNTLKSQTIINRCNIYLISDNSPDEEKVFDAFHGYNLNCWFLKNTKREGPGVARNIGLDNCFGEYVLFLDFDDEFCHNNDLENLYELCKKNDKYDFLYFDLIKNNIIESNEKLIIKNSKIKEYNLHFPSLYICEDGYFANLCHLFLKGKYNNYIYYKYNQDDNSSYIGHYIHNKSICDIFSTFLFLKNYNKELHNQEILEPLLIKMLKGSNWLKELKEKENKNELNYNFFYGLTLLLNSLLYNYYQKEYNNLVFDNNSDEYMFLKKIQNKNYSIEIFNHITYDLNDLQKKIISILQNINTIGVNAILSQNNLFDFN